MFSSFAEIEQDSNYVKARQQVSVQLRRLAKQPQPALRPDTVPADEVIAAWLRWWNNGRDRMKDLLLTEQWNTTGTCFYPILATSSLINMSKPL